MITLAWLRSQKTRKLSILLTVAYLLLTVQCLEHRTYLKSITECYWLNHLTWILNLTNWTSPLYMAFVFVSVAQKLKPEKSQ